jgi:hypothetical protein
MRKKRTMLSEKQLAANRANAQRSTGPQSVEGKNRSKLNATRHNLTGQVAALTEPDRVAFNAFSQDLLCDLEPRGAMELQLAQRIVSDSWRLNRASAIEDNLYALGHYEGESADPNNHAQIEDAFNAAETFARQAKNLQLLSLYEQRLNRTVQKNIALLKSLQAERKARRSAEMEEAKRLLHLSEMRNIPYQPAKDGFVFSVNEIHHAIDLQRRLDQNHCPDFRHFKPRQFAAQAA